MFNISVIRFQILADFEERACTRFDTPIEDGFTFEQEALHREFCRLFDGFCTGFLREKGLSEEDFQRTLQVGECLHVGFTWLDTFTLLIPFGYQPELLILPNSTLP